MNIPFQNKNHFLLMMTNLMKKMMKKMIKNKDIDISLSINQIDTKNCTVLTYACMFNEEELALRLLNIKNINYNYINKINKTNQSILISACENRMKKLIKILLSKPDI